MPSCGLFKCKGFGVGVLPNLDGIARFHLSAKDTLAKAVLDVVLDGAFQRAGAKLHVVAFRGDKLLRSIADLDVVTHVLHTAHQFAELDVDNLLDGLHVELVEGDDLVETVEELRGKLLAQALLDDRAGMLLVALVDAQSERACGVESHAAAKLLQLAGTGIRGHDDHGVAEVNQPAVAIGKAALVKHLQQQVEHVAMGFL